MHQKEHFSKALLPNRLQTISAALLICMHFQVDAVVSLSPSPTSDGHATITVPANYTFDSGYLVLVTSPSGATGSITGTTLNLSTPGSYLLEFKTTYTPTNLIIYDRVNISYILPTLLGHWKLDDGSGTSAADSSTYARAAILSGSPTPSWTAGYLLNALSFTESSLMYAAVTSSTGMSFNSSDPITIAAWIKPTWLASGHTETILSKGADGGTRNFLFSTFGSSTAGHGYVGFWYTSASGSQVYQTSTAVIDQGSWTHVAVTYTFGTGSSMKMYVNGSLSSGSWTTGNGNVAPNTNANYVAIGSETNSASNERFDGKIDDVWLHKAILTATDISNLASEAPTGGG